MGMNFGRNKEIEVDIVNLDLSKDDSLSPKKKRESSEQVGEGSLSVVSVRIQPQMSFKVKQRRMEIQKLKIATSDKVRLNKRSETIRSMKFIRKLGKKLR